MNCGSRGLNTPPHIINCVCVRELRAHFDQPIIINHRCCGEKVDSQGAAARGERVPVDFFAQDN